MKNKMQTRLSYLVALGALALGSESAMANFKFGIHYMPSYTVPLVSGTGAVGLGAFNGFGPGASVNYMFGASQMFGFHLEGAYVSRNITSNNLGYGIYGSIGPRLTVKNILSFYVGAGYYYALVQNTGAFAGLPHSFLVSGGIDVDVPVAKVVALTFGARYVLPFSDVSVSTANTVQPSQVMAQVGLRFGQFGK